jgi:hypothetical protein
MNSGSTSIDRQAETQAPHWMQAIDCVTSSIDSGGTMYSCPSGGSSAGSNQGTTRRIFFQCTASMSVTRSLSTGMLPIGSIVIAPSRARSAASPMRVLHASADWPLMRTPQEPQMAARHEQRIAIEASSRSLIWRMPSSTERSGGSSTSKSAQYAGSPDSGSKRRIFSA